MEKLEELLMYLNEKKRESEALAKLVRIHNSMVWKEEVIMHSQLIPKRWSQT